MVAEAGDPRNLCYARAGAAAEAGGRPRPPLWSRRYLPGESFRIISDHDVRPRGQ
jgi:hypothetical protein